MRTSSSAAIVAIISIWASACDHQAPVPTPMADGGATGTGTTGGINAGTTGGIGGGTTGGSGSGTTGGASAGATGGSSGSASSGAVDGGDRREIGVFVYVTRDGSLTDAQLFQPLTAWACEYGVSPAIWHGFYSWKHQMVQADGGIIIPDGTQPIDTSHTSYWMYDDGASWWPDAGFGAPGSGQNLGAKRFVDFVYSEFPGAIPEITWRAAGSDQNYQVENFASWQPEFTLDQINAGAHDAYLNAYAKQVAADGRPMYFRIFHECNGDNYPYTYNNPFQAQNAQFEPFAYGIPDAGYSNGDELTCPNASNGSYGKLALAFRHVVAIFRQNGATNVRWVWNVGSGSTFPPPLAPDGGLTLLPYPNLPQPQVWTGYYPGDDVVDVAAMDGYNHYRLGVWKETSEIFGKAYDAITKITGKPMQITEMASDENPADAGWKEGWIVNAFGVDQADAGAGSFPVRFPQIEQVVTFDHNSKGDAFAFDSSPESKAAWEEVLSSGIYALVPITASTVCDGGI
ncbi:MAG: glycoside hydrolase family 26 protein [Deltaproteobacteria bacterium]